jgi:hypothetical protein
MHARRSALLSLTLSVVAVGSGCGRDSLYIGPPLDDDGGSTMSAAGGMGAGGSGGLGGEEPVDPCTELTLDGPIATPVDGMTADAQLGVLTWGAASTTAVLVASYDDPMGNGPSELRHTAFEPWDAWPEDGLFEPGHLVDDSGATQFTAERGVEGHFAVSFIRPPPAQGLTVGIDYLAHDPKPSQIGGLVAASASELLASGHGASAYLVPASQGEQQAFVVLPYNSDNGFKWGGSYPVGCTVGPAIVAVTGTFDGSLVAAHQGSSIGKSCATTSAGPPQGIVTGRSGITSNSKVSPGVTLSDDTPLSMHMEADGVGGGWLFWQSVAAPNEIHVAHLNENANPIGDQVVLDVASGSQWRGFATSASLWVADLASNGELTLSRFSHAGELRASGSALVGTSGPTPPSLLVSPTDDKALVGVDEIGGTGGRVVVARFACNHILD